MMPKQFINRCHHFALTKTCSVSIMRALEKDRMESYSGISAVW